MFFLGIEYFFIGFFWSTSLNFTFILRKMFPLSVFLHDPSFLYSKTPLAGHALTLFFFFIMLKVVPSFQSQGPPPLSPSQYNPSIDECILNIVVFSSSMSTGTDPPGPSPKKIRYSLPDFQYFFSHSTHYSVTKRGN